MPQNYNNLTFHPTGFKKHLKKIKKKENCSQLQLFLIDQAEGKKYGITQFWEKYYRIAIYFADLIQTSASDYIYTLKKHACTPWLLLHQADWHKS